MQANNTEAAEKWETKVNSAEEKVERAEEKVDRAKVELDRAKQDLKEAKEAAKASVPAGRVQAGASACAVVAVDFGLQHSRMVVVRFRAVVALRLRLFLVFVCRQDLLF